MQAQKAREAHLAKMRAMLKPAEAAEEESAATGETVAKPAAPKPAEKKSAQTASKPASKKAPAKKPVAKKKGKR
jgi:hypothetical protein